MPTFAFQARDGRGQSISGTRDANDQRAALEALREAGLFVLDLKPTKSGTSSAPPIPAEPRQSTLEAAQSVAADAPNVGAPNVGAPNVGVPNGGAIPVGSQAPKPPSSRVAAAKLPIDYKARANSKQVSLFFRQMYSMLHAGSSLARSLEIVASHDANRHLRRAAHAMSVATSRGQGWSESMRAFPGLFSPLMIGMVAAGEKGGFLDRICLNLSENAERDYNIQQTIKRETWYPKMLVWMSFLIPSVVVLVLHGFGAWLKAVIPPTCAILAVLAVWKTFTHFQPLLGHQRPFIKIWDTIKLSVPISGKVTRGFATAKFCRALGAMYASGMAPHAAIRLAAEACGNTVVEDSALSIIPCVERGEGMASSLASTRQFPPIALQMLRTGEETGQIDTQLDHVAEFLETDSETALKQAVKTFAVLVYLMIAAYIGVQVVSFYVGSFNAAFDAGEAAAN